MFGIVSKGGTIAVKKPGIADVKDRFVVGKKFLGLQLIAIVLN
ncbi:hypothetical protein [Virgibacillus senegalensis]|nr:hypothetical protein [Virgibacillus senegalensis]